MKNQIDYIAFASFNAANNEQSCMKLKCPLINEYHYGFEYLTYVTDLWF
jgi:hypothetical protein